VIKIIGRINNNASTKLLVIHSKNLTEEIIRAGQKIRLENFKDGVILKPGKEIHATVAAKKRIQIAIGKLTKNRIIDPSIINKKSISVYLDLKDWNLKNVFQKSRGSPITEKSPKDLIMKKAALRTNNLKRYFLDISSKKLNELAKIKHIRCLLNRKEGGLIIVRSDNIEARKLTSHSKGRVQIAIPSGILREEEIAKLKEKSWLPVNIKLNLESFGLRILDFYSVKEEKDLVEELTNKGLEIKAKDYTDPYDIYLPEQNIAIEIHNSVPTRDDLSTRHKVKPALVRLRILEADYFVKNKELSRYCVILNKKWEAGKYIQEIMINLDKRVRILFTDYQNEWGGKICKMITGSTETTK